MLDQQPAAPVAVGSFRAYEHPRALQLVAVERELEVPFFQRRIDVVDFRLPGAAVPQQHDAGAVAFGNHPFEFAVLDRMIFDVHRETLCRGIERRTFRHGPRQQHAVVFQTEVVVKMAREVFLNAEKPIRFLCGRLADGGRRAGGFGGLLEVALLFVFF